MKTTRPSREGRVGGKVKVGSGNPILAFPRTALNQNICHSCGARFTPLHEAEQAELPPAAGRCLAGGAPVNAASLRDRIVLAVACRLAAHGIGSRRISLAVDRLVVRAEMQS